MSPPDKTPAPSRRFVHPSSSANQPPSTARRPALAFSQARAPPSSASPYGRIFQSDRRPVVKDEISTSFEGEDGASPSVLDRADSPLRHASKKHDEVIDEEASDSEVRAHPSIGGFIRPDRPLSEEALPDAPEFETPAPKRRRTAKAHKPDDEIVAISSSPSQPGSATVSEDEDEQSSPLQFSTTANVSRFRTLAPVIKTEDRSSSKPVFRSIDRDKAGSAELSAVLPDAFTPSKRKGKKDYLGGGLADSVRSWILQAATEESHRSVDEHEILVSVATLDESGRSIAITTTTDERWLLVGTQRWSSASISNETVARIRSSGKIVVRGINTLWTIPLQALEGGHDIRVAAHWDLPP